MKILVVDDSKAMRMIVTRSLRQSSIDGLQTVEASNGVEAFEKLKSESPDLVLSDWNMPEMNGIDFLKQVRESGNNVRFGFVTSESSGEVREQAIEAGAQFVVTKPFTPESLEQAILEVTG